jgi:hypothetical protein
LSGIKSGFVGQKPAFQSRLRAGDAPPAEICHRVGVEIFGPFKKSFIRSGNIVGHLIPPYADRKPAAAAADFTSLALEYHAMEIMSTTLAINPASVEVTIISMATRLISVDTNFVSLAINLISMSIKFTSTVISIYSPDKKYNFLHMSIMKILCYFK